MKRSISTLLTTLLLSVVMMPIAMAQTQDSSFLIGSAMSSMDTSEQPTSDATKPTPLKTEASPEPSDRSTPAARTIDSNKSRPSVNSSSDDSSYPAYCLPLSSGIQPDDWLYREALYNCLHGS